MSKNEICSFMVNEMKKENDTFFSLWIEDTVSPNMYYFYISDLHLDYKIENEKEKDNNFDEEQYIVDSASKLVRSLKRGLKAYEAQNWLLLLGGDITYNLQHLSIFFDTFTKKGSIVDVSSHTLFVPGNHELWDENGPAENRLNEIKKIVEKYGITFLNNEVYLWGRSFPTGSLTEATGRNAKKLLKDVIFSSEEDRIQKEKEKYYEILHKNQEEFINYKRSEVIRYNDLLSMDDDALKKLACSYSEIILGGVGFSGFNTEYNAASGIYKGTITTIEEDKKYTGLFIKAYEKLNKSLQESNVICFTHNPMSDWGLTTINEKWIYLYGHTHKNVLVDTDKEHIIADNQIGYKKKTFELKVFTKEYSFNPFKSYSDGIYDITRWDYLSFNESYGIRVHFDRETTHNIKMIKKSDSYMFFAQNKKNNRLFLLNGGKMKGVNHPINYFYENLDIYQSAIDQWVSLVQEKLHMISDYVKSFGGSGKIHGLIVDVDFTSHLYLNLLDNKLIPYYAVSMRDKWVYSDLPNLLENHRPDLYQKYIENGKLNTYKITRLRKVDSSKFVSDTSIYKYSNKMHSYQYALEKKIIRTWDDNVIKKAKGLLIEEE